MPEPRLRTVAQAALALRRDRPSASSRRFQGASFIQSARDVQIHDGTFNVIGGDVHHHYAPSQQQPTLADVFRALPNARNTQADVLSKATEGTGQGLLQSDRFQAWVSPTGKLKTLWGRGKAGAGKTIQASIVIKDLEARAKASNGQICVAYVYLRYSEAAEITIRTVLEALVKQTVERHPQCLALAEEVYDQHLLEDTEPSEAELLELLAQFTRIIPTTFYTLEALDEAPPGIQLPLIKKLSSLNVKLFITSRPLPAVEAAFGDAEVIQIVPQDHDLDLHIEKAIEDCPYLQGMLHRAGPSLKEEILSMVKSRCDGMFLHVSLHLDAIQQCLSIRDVQQTLQNFPDRIEDAYIEMWNRIMHLSSRHVLIAKKVLLWVVNAPRSMTVAELQQAVGTHPETFGFEQDRVVPEASLIPLCCGLVTVDDKSRLVRLVHYTAKPTLEKVLIEFMPQPHALITAVCLTHLTKRGFPNSSISSGEDFQAALDVDPLLKYAHYSWAFHSRNSLDDDASAERTKHFVQSCKSYPILVPVAGFDIFRSLHVAVASKLPLSMVSPTEIDNPNLVSSTKKLSPLTLASIYGNSDAVKLLLGRHDTQINVADVDSWTELHYACRSGRRSILEDLLRQPNINVNAKSTNGWTPLMQACSRGYVGCVKLLLASPGIDINAVNDKRWSALMMAAIKGYDAIVQLLLAHPGVAPNLADEDGWTALMLATGGGHDSTVGHFLAHPEVDVNHLSHGATDSPPKVLSALMIACLKAREGIIKLLLADPRTDHHLKNQDGISALLFAADEGLVETVNTLVASATPSEVHQPGFKNTTALMAAAAQGHAKVVKILLALPGVNINAVDDNNETAIKMAAEYGDEETVHLLLDVPSIDIDVKGLKDEHTALSVALEKGHEPIVNLLRDFEERTMANPNHLQG